MRRHVPWATFALLVAIAGGLSWTPAFGQTAYFAQFRAKRSSRTANVTVRDHRSGRAGPVTRDHRTSTRGPNVRDHRTGAGNVATRDPNVQVVQPGLINTGGASVPVWRVQLKLVTANVRDAGTDDPVWVSLAGRNVNWINYPGDDFERGRTATYDLLQIDSAGRTAIANLSDIGKLRIGKKGTDGWCLRAIELAVNGRTIYRETFRSPGLWIDGNDGHAPSYTVSSSRLRRNAAWTGWRPPKPPLVIPRDELESRLAAIIGHFLYAGGDKAYWGHLHGRGVEVTQKNDSTVHVDLDLAGRIPGPDPEIDVDFDIQFSCRDGRIELTTSKPKVDVDSSVAAKVLSLGLYHLLDEVILEDLIVDKEIKKAFDGRTFQVDTGGAQCPTIQVWHNGDILIWPSRG